mmetsp:Transcript_9383/g.19808  ORF Transcript_9383/g.19808 Transcript_9383/m.19808 type:complete len:503 (+) Transcript_9383:101-1609(+)
MTKNNHLLPLIHLILLGAGITSVSSRPSDSGSHRDVPHRQRYNLYDYDLTTPQFTPDGRLLQVEYATESTRRRETNPIVCVATSVPGRGAWAWRSSHVDTKSLVENTSADALQDCLRRDDHPDDEEGDTILIMATISIPPPSPLSSETPNDTEMNSSRDAAKSTSRRTQFRIVEVPISTFYHTKSTPQTPHINQSTTSRQSSTILVGMSGILSDATSLLKLIYSTLEEEQRMFGWNRMHLVPVGNVDINDRVHVDINDTDGTQTAMPTSSSVTTQFTTETTLRLSRVIADQCQKHAFGGGLRPLGASLILAGVDHHLYRKKSGTGDETEGMVAIDEKCCGSRVAMCETDPSGSCRSKAATLTSRWTTGLGARKAETDDDMRVLISHPRIAVSGGSIQSRKKLQSSVEERFREFHRNYFSDSGDKSDISEDESRGQKQFIQKSLRLVISSLLDEWKNRENVPLANVRGTMESDMALPPMEVVFVSSRRGTFRLSHDDIASIMS